MLLRQLYEAKAKRIVAIMPGGFHPFHPGHKSLYDWAVKSFGQSNVYVAATSDTLSRPFPFDVKKKLAIMSGVPQNNFIEVKSPFNAASYKQLIDDNSALVFVRSTKDKDNHPKPDQIKKNGEPGYLRSYAGKDLNTADEMGYMVYGPAVDFDFGGMQIKSASELRSGWPTMSSQDKSKAAQLMYGKNGSVAAKLLDDALGSNEVATSEDDQNTSTPDVTGQDLQKLEKYLNQLFSSLDIDFIFTRHFFNQINHSRNSPKITIAEIVTLFNNAYRKWGQKISQMRPEAQAVIKSMSTDINLPFVLNWDETGEGIDLVAKTVMRKKNFQTSNQVLQVENTCSKVHRGTNEMASYTGNIGMMELVQFYRKAKENDDSALIDKVRSLIDDGQDQAVWKIVQEYTGTKLAGKEFAYESIAEMIRIEHASINEAARQQNLCWDSVTNKWNPLT